MMLGLLRRFVPPSWRASFDATRSLWFRYAHLHSARSKTCLDTDRKPIPWYTYPATEYLEQLDFSDASVFEYGSGNSTLFWAARAKHVVSVEDDRAWFQKLSEKRPPNCELILETDLYEYPGVIGRVDGLFDVIVIDGAARGNTRLKCARLAIERLRKGGMIILDNSDWLPESARVLRSAGFIEIDMAGFGPVNGYTWTTSLFLDRAYAFRPRSARQPTPSLGAWPQTWEHPISREPPVVECGDDVYPAVRRDERFTIDAPAGPEEFRFIVSERPADGLRSVALLEVRRERVLLSLNESMTSRPVIEAQLEAVMRMTWDEFRTFVNGHDKRRYDLGPAAADGTRRWPQVSTV